MEPFIFIFRYRGCDGHFPCLGKDIFPQRLTVVLRALVHLRYLAIFKNFFKKLF